MKAIGLTGRLFYLLTLFPFLIHAQLKSPDNRADYIVITPSQFTQTIQPLVKLHEAEGLAVETAGLNDIYAEFKDTLSDQQAISNFISYALTYWQNPKPKYVLLVGNTEYIPTLRVPSMFSDYVPFYEDSVSLDDGYSFDNYSNNSQHEIAVGRFPVHNESELKAVINKTIYFEDSASAWNYPDDFIILADRDKYGEFYNSAEQFIQTAVAGKYTSLNIFTDLDSNRTDIRNKLFGAINAGSMFLTYFGHGKYNLWSADSFLTASDINTLVNNKNPFVLTAVACSQDFDIPTDSSIVNSLLTKTSGGAVATIASSGLSFLSNGRDFLDSFVSKLEGNSSISLGEAFLQTKNLLDHAPNIDNAIRRYTFLGDPALKLPANPVAGVKGKPENIPARYTLFQNYPNPFNPTTVIAYQVPANGFVTLKVYDLLGNEVANLINEYQSAGRYSITFNSEQTKGRRQLSSGIYIYRLTAGNFSASKKMILVK